MERQGAVLNQIVALYEGGSVGGLTDAQLVERFANEGGETAAVAFSTLVERHGPMVMRVCRAALRNEHDAEDAFQAVFLILARKAGTLWMRDSLGPWLHAVALRTSTNARSQTEQRRLHEARRMQMSRQRAEPTDQDFVAAVHEEVSRLPDRFREAVVLCDLEGLSHEMAARQLGWPVGTVKSRQSRGRERLRSRLARRGMAPSDAALATALVPPPVALSTVRATVTAASIFRAGQAATAGLVSAPAAALARGLLRAMMMNRIKLGVLSILAAGTAVSGAVVLIGAMTMAEGPPSNGPRPGGPPGAAVPAATRPPAGSLFAMRIAANRKHDADAADGNGYRWVKVDPRGELSLDGLVTRADKDNAQTVLVKLDPQNVTERDVIEVKKVPDEHGRLAISFRLTPDGSKRFGALTRAHLPEDGGAFRYRLALIVEGVAIALPVINSEIREAGIIEFGPETRADEVDRLVGLLAKAASDNAPPLKAKAVKDQAEAIREAKRVDLPALAEANRVSIESAASGSRLNLANPKDVEQFRRVLRPSEVPPSGGLRAATLSFYRDEELIRKVWVYQGGEWGFERPGTSWTTGADAELWRLVESRLLK